MGHFGVTIALLSLLGVGRKYTFIGQCLYDDFLFNFCLCFAFSGFWKFSDFSGRVMFLVETIC